MATKVKKLNKRGFVESTKHSNSWYHVEDQYGEVSLTLADCNRRISWSFSEKGSDRGKRKIDKLKKLVDELHAYLHEVEK